MPGRNLHRASRRRVLGDMQGGAMALPFSDSRFDAAVMALVIFFVPEPAKGVAEMVRVVAPGGIVAAYAWDMAGERDGYPGGPVQGEMRAMGYPHPMPPSVEASRLENLRALWTEVGLESVETREITVSRSFADFDEFWAIVRLGNIGPVVAGMPSADAERLAGRVRALLPADATGRITCTGRANAVRGIVPQ